MKKNIFTEALWSDTLMVRYVKFFSQYLQMKKYNYIKRMSISLIWARRFCRKLIRKSGNIALSNVNDERFVSSCWLKSNSAICPAETIKWRAAFFILKILKLLKLRSASDENTNFAIIWDSAKQIFIIHEQCIFFSYGKLIKLPLPNTALFQVVKRSYTNIHALVTMSPWFFTGFTEGCFTVSITKNQNLKVGWRVKLLFNIELHKRDIPVLESIKKDEGEISKSGANAMKFYIQSKENYNVLFKHFDKFGLITQKRADYELFKEVFKLTELKEHLTEDGLQKIIAIKASMNWGLSEELKKAFPNVVPVVRPLIKNHLRSSGPDPYWLSGFTSDPPTPYYFFNKKIIGVGGSEGSFMIAIKKSPTHSLGYLVHLELVITQRDGLLIKSFPYYFQCGRVEHLKNKATVNFTVSKFKDIYDKIIPFFKKYPILGVKGWDFDDWCKVAEIIKDKKHLTQEGFEKIKKIPAGMNNSRRGDR